MDLYLRETKVSVETVNKNMQVTSYLIDKVHELELVLTVEPGSMEIKDIATRMIRVPYAVCPQALETINNIIGLRVKPGINKQVAELIGGTKGCVHLIYLLKEAFNAAVQGNTRISLKDKEGEDKIKSLESIFNNTCIRYTKENSLLTSHF